MSRIEVYEAIERAQEAMYQDNQLAEDPYHNLFNTLGQLMRDIRKAMTKEETSVLENRKTHPKTREPYSSVLQPWVQRLTYMQQSVLMTATRGPDGIAKNHKVKVLIRWYRRCVLLSAFEAKVFEDPYERGGGSFTGPLLLPTMGQIEGYVGDYLQHVDELPHHFQLHFMHAAEIVGYKHPHEETREFWRQFYYSVVKDAHLHAETEAQMDRRLGDKVDTWLEGEVEVAK